MAPVVFRKFVTNLQETWVVDGQLLTSSVKKAWAAAVVTLDTEEIPDLELLANTGEVLGEELGKRLVSALNAPAGSALAYGKGALIGFGCAMEHGAALLHPKMGKSFRRVVGQGSAIIPSTTKRAIAGTVLDVPLQGATDEWNFAMLDTVSVMVDDAPLNNEIVVVASLAYGARPGAVIGSQQSSG